jgi:hypothetical protein
MDFRAGAGPIRQPIPRASCIFPASRKASAFARAWLSDDRSAGDSLPTLAPDARAAGLLWLIPTNPNRFQRATISIVGASIAMPVYGPTAPPLTACPLVRVGRPRHNWQGAATPQAGTVSEKDGIIMPGLCREWVEAV